MRVAHALGHGRRVSADEGRRARRRRSMPGVARSRGRSTWPTPSASAAAYSSRSRSSADAAGREARSAGHSPASPRVAQHDRRAPVRPPPRAGAASRSRRSRRPDGRPRPSVESASSRILSWAVFDTALRSMSRCAMPSSPTTTSYAVLGLLSVRPVDDLRAGQAGAAQPELVLAPGRAQAVRRAQAARRRRVRRRDRALHRQAPQPRVRHHRRGPRRAAGVAGRAAGAAAVEFEGMVKVFFADCGRPRPAPRHAATRSSPRPRSG